MYKRLQQDIRTCPQVQSLTMIGANYLQKRAGDDVAHVRSRWKCCTSHVDAADQLGIALSSSAPGLKLVLAMVVIHVTRGQK